MDEEYKFTWKISNFLLFIETRTEYLISLPFKPPTMEDTKWHLILDPQSHSPYVGCLLRRAANDGGPPEIRMRCYIQIISCTGLPLYRKELDMEFVKGFEFGYASYVEREKFQTQSDMVSNGIVTLQCVVRKVKLKRLHTEKCVARTTLDCHRVSFDWRIEHAIEYSSKELSISMSSMNIDLVPGLECNTSANMLLLDGDGVVQIEFQTNNWENREKTLVFMADITVLDVDGEVTPISCQGRHAFTKRYEIWRFPDFLCKWELLKNVHKYLPDGALTLRCKFAISDGSSKHHIEESTLVDYTNRVPKCQLTVDMENLFKNGKFTDINLRTSEGTIAAHRCILESRSTVFSELLEKLESNESTSKDVLDVSDIDSETWRHVLQYMYTDKVADLTFERAVNLYSAAVKYQILSLKSACMERIVPNLTTDSVCSVLILADEFSDLELKSHILDFISEYWNEILLSDEWDGLVKSRKSLAEEIIEGLRQKRAAY